MGWHVDQMGQNGCENLVSECTEALSTASGLRGVCNKLLAVIVTVIVPPSSALRHQSNTWEAHQELRFLRVAFKIATVTSCLLQVLL